MKKLRPIEVAEQQLERILAEFPWLWAVQNRWSPLHDKVQIKNGDERFFQKTTPPFCWIKSRDLYTRESHVSELMSTGEPQIVAKRILSELERLSKTSVLESIVVRNSFEQAWFENEHMPDNPALRKFYKRYTLYRSSFGYNSLESMLRRSLRQTD